MENEQNLSYHDAILLFTHLKIELANRLKSGIDFEDVVKFEEELEKIDQTLKFEQENLLNNLQEGPDH